MPSLPLATQTNNYDFSPVPSNTADLDETWAYLCEGVDHIMNTHNASLPLKTFTNLYTTVYNYCTSRKMHGKVDPSHRSGANLVGSDLYNKLSEWLILHLKPMLERANTLTDVDLLRYYADEWSRYTTGAEYLNRLFVFMNRYWVKRQRDEGNNSILPVYTLALAQWKEHFFMPIQRDDSKLVKAMLHLITQERNGETVDQSLVKTVISSFVSLGLDTADPTKECLDVYQDQFETMFFQATEEYYKKESETLLANNYISDYLKKAEGRLREEENRAKCYLPTKTCKDLIDKCENVLIRIRVARVER